MQKLDVIIKTAEVLAEENNILSKFYSAAGEAAETIKTEMNTKVSEFDNIALALSALQGNVPVISIDVLFDGLPEFQEALAKYTGDESTAYGRIVNQSKDALYVTGTLLIDSILNIKILEMALQIEEPPRDYVGWKLKMHAERNANTPEDSESESENATEKTDDAPDQQLVHPEILEKMSPPDAANAVIEAFEMKNNVHVDQVIAEAMVSSDAKPEFDDNKSEELAERIREFLEPDVKAMTPDQQFDSLFGIPKSEIEESLPDEAKRALNEMNTAPPVSPKSQKEESHHPAKPPKRPGSPTHRAELPEGFTKLVIPGFPEDRFMLSIKNELVDRKTMRIIAPDRNGVVKLYHPRDEEGKLRYEFVNLKEVLAQTHHPNIEAAMLPVIASASAETDEYVYADWFPGIPARKYRVYKSGRVYDTVHGEWIPPDRKHESIRLTDSDKESRTIGVHATVKQLKRQSLIWQAFHPESRDQAHCYISFRDGDRQNCALDNLYVGRSAK